MYIILRVMHIILRAMYIMRRVTYIMLRVIYIRLRVMCIKLYLVYIAAKLMHSMPKVMRLYRKPHTRKGNPQVLSYRSIPTPSLWQYCWIYLMAISLPSWSALFKSSQAPFLSLLAILMAARFTYTEG